ncbi:hypothetical protein ROZALSC1DRAFT_31228, partial [Rozella allomycis CSF55]
MKLKLKLAEEAREPKKILKKVISKPVPRPIIPEYALSAILKDKVLPNLENIEGISTRDLFQKVIFGCFNELMSLTEVMPKILDIKNSGNIDDCENNFMNEWKELVSKALIREEINGDIKVSFENLKVKMRVGEIATLSLKYEPQFDASWKWVFEDVDFELSFCVSVHNVRQIFSVQQKQMTLAHLQVVYEASGWTRVFERINELSVLIQLGMLNLHASKTILVSASVTYEPNKDIRVNYWNHKQDKRNKMIIQKEGNKLMAINSFIGFRMEIDKNALSFEKIISNLYNFHGQLLLNEFKEKLKDKIVFDDENGFNLTREIYLTLIFDSQRGLLRISRNGRELELTRII